MPSFQVSDGQAFIDPAAVGVSDGAVFVDTTVYVSDGSEFNVAFDQIDTPAEIRSYSGNPRYWEYGGEPTILYGGSDEDNPFQWGDPLWTDQLDLLTSLGGNYIRNVMSDREQYGSSLHPDRNDDARAFVDTGTDEYDLDQKNQTYFDRLDTFLQLCLDRDIIVQVELWDPWDMDAEAWDTVPWNPANNINYTAAETILQTSESDDPLTDENGFFDTVPDEQNDTIVLPYQEQFLEWVLDVTLQYPNILYTPTNEGREEDAWDIYWTGFVRDYADKDVFVGPMHDPPESTVVNNEDFDFLDTSQHSESTTEQHGNALDGDLDDTSANPIPINNTKLYDQNDEGAAKLWRSIFCGSASARYHRGDFGNANYGLGLNDQAQAHIESMTNVLEKVDVFGLDLQRHHEVDHLLAHRDSDEAWLMANPGSVYLVFFPKKGSRTGNVELDVSDVSGDVQVEWRDIEGEIWHSTETLAGDTVLLTTPTDGEHWAAVVTAS